eukprot:COSAG01_NODE_16431_length_1236_cov_38.089710_1_plen_152_part_01
MGGHRGACGVSPKHRGGGEASWTLPLPPAQRRAPPALLSLLYPLAPREGCLQPCCHSCCHWLRGRGAHSLLPPPQPLAPVVRRRRLRHSLRSRRLRGESAHCRCRSCSRCYPLASHPAVIDDLPPLHLVASCEEDYELFKTGLSFIHQEHQR